MYFDKRILYFLIIVIVLNSAWGLFANTDRLVGLLLNSNNIS